MSKLNFAFDVSTLSDYTNENTGLLAKAIYGARTIQSGIEILPGQKGDVKLNKLSHTLTLAAEACGWSVAGGTVLTQASVEVCPIQYEEALCPSTLEPKWYGQIMKAGSTPEELPFEKYIVDTKADTLSSEVEKLFWQGDTTNGSGNLALCTGMIDYMSGATQSGTKVTMDLSVGTIVAAVNALIAGADERVYEEDDLAIYMSVSNFRTYVTALINANLYNYANSIDGKSLEIVVPGHNVTIYGTPGLTGTDVVFMTPKSNLVFVTDLLSETETLDLWWSQDNREIRIAGSFKFGVGVYFGEFVTHNQDW